jgi:type I restriction enzyme S subunit
MNAARLLEHFDRISDASDAVPRLRRFVLDLAVRGGLSAPVNNDKPVSIADAKGRAPQAKAVDLPVDALPFTVPAAWRWAYLTEIANVSYGFAFASSKFNGSQKGMPLIRIRDIANLDTEAYFDGDYEEQYIVRKGDYVVGMDGSFNVRRWKGSDALLNQRVLRINDWHQDALDAWCQIPLQMILDHVHGQTSQTTVKHLSAKQMNGVRIPLPPLAEQQRIVAKVDELMALCDRLEAAQVERESRRNRLVAASLARVTQPAAADDASDARAAGFHLDHFARLTTRPEHVKHLRQTILNLAVRGRLVPQDPADDSAAFLIAADGTQTMRSSRSSRSTAGANHDEKGPGLICPPGWINTTLGAATRIRTGKLDANAAKPNGKYPFFTCSRTTLQIDSFSFDTAAVLLAGNGDFNLKCFTGKFDVYQRTYVIEPLGWDVGFLFVLMQSEIARITKNHRGTAIPHLKLGDIADLQVALPPLAEQRRIVAKVDELMALCDQLEASLAAAATDRARLLESLLHEALAPAA